MLSAAPLLAVALAAPAAVFATEAPLPGPTAGWGLSDAWRESLSRALGAERNAPGAGVPSLRSALPDSYIDERQVRVRVSASWSPRVMVSMPAYVSPDGFGGIDVTGKARRPSAGQMDNGLADRTLWGASAEAWRDAGPVTAYAGAGTGKGDAGNSFSQARPERNAYAGLEFVAGPGLWHAESAWARGGTLNGTERDTRIGWRGLLARGWSLGIEASALRSPDFSQRSVALSLRGALR